MRFKSELAYGEANLEKHFLAVGSLEVYPRLTILLLFE